MWPEFELVGADGVVATLDDDPIRDRLGGARYVPSMDALVASPVDPEACRLILGKFVDAWRAAGVLPTDESAFDRLIVYKATYELTGPSRPESPAERVEHFQVPWSDLARESRLAKR